MKTFITLPVKLCLLFSLFVLFAFTRKGDEPIDKLVTALQHWTDSIPQEKVYLHMDKPYYALGDTIWFKGYLTIGSRHQLSALSGAVYVDLITEQDSLVRSLKLPVTSGMVMGDFILSDDLKQGSYRIRAYTQWMRNAGPEYFYDHTFTVGDLLSNNIITKADYRYKDEAGKSVLTAMLNYTDDQGKPLAGRDVRYTIMIGKKAVWSQNVKTDASGNVPIKISNDKHTDLAGSYIHTSIQGSNKQPLYRDFPIKAGLLQTDVQFFPESGNLVNGIASRVAFKAVGIDGLGTAIKGKITDNENKEVATIETLHAGMGSFSLKPEAGKSYTANITFADNTTKNIALPGAADGGYVLSVYQPNKDSVLVRIHASANKLNSTVNLIAHSSGETIFAAPVKINGVLTSIWLEKKSFPSGIAQFTLFGNDNEPLNERIAFIKANDKMHLAISTAKTTYGSKEHVLMDLEAKDSKGKPTFGNFSVAVTDESKVPVDESAESTIFSNILLTSDIKGYVEKPNYYFINDNDETDRALDNLMLTQGYRRFEWKDLNNTVSTKPIFAVEGWGSKISGTATTLGHKPLANANIILMALKAGVTKGTTTDANGRFKFDSLFVTDSIKITIQARTAKNSDRVILTLDTTPTVKRNINPNYPDVSTNISATLKTYLDMGKREDDIYEQTGQLDKVHRLREVRINAKKVEASSGITPQGMFKIPEGSADQVITIPNPDDYTTLGMALQARLPGVSVTSNLGYTTLKELRSGSPISLILDGRKITNADEISEILEGSVMPEDVAKIEMVRTNQAMLSFLRGPGDNSAGYVLILTKLGYTRKQYNPNIANIIPKGFNKVREFYSPRYDRPGNAAKLPDLRTTVFWNPYLKTDISGKGTFNFFNADGPGTYRVVVEGINAAGELGRQVFHYTVDGSQAATVSSAGAALTASADKGLSLITTPLDNLNKRLPVEKVYLHTDKSYYNIDDTLWFKSYLVDGASLAPSKLSKFLYVDIIDDTVVVARRISIPIKDGLGWGQIPLPKKIFHPGGYTIRAYTNWMQNFGDDYFFTQRFYLGLPTQAGWLVKSNAVIKPAGDKDQLQVEIKLNRSDKLNSPVAVHKVQVKIFESRDSLYRNEYYIYKENMQTGIDGSLKFSQELDKKAKTGLLTVTITPLEKDDSGNVLRVPLNLNLDKKIDLQFLPESGKLVAGLKSVVGFKAVGQDGTGVSVAGGVYDSKGNQVAHFTTLYKGMGSFEFTPAANETYSAKLDAQTTKKFWFPKVNPAGTVMHIDNPEGDGQIKIALSGLKDLKADSACYLLGMSRGVVYYTQQVALNQADLTVDKKLFPTGVVKFTFFKGKTPLNERAVFIDNHDQLSIKITSNKTGYQKRDSVGLDIEVKDKSGIPVQGSFSLAVTDDSQLKPDSLDNNGIAASLLINSELRGHIESPGYYITRTDKSAWQALDNLMLTQGWTGYDWKDIFAPAKPVQFEAEKEFKVTGRVSNLFNKPVANAQVLISSQKPNFIATTNTDEKGIYTFKKLPQIDSGSFFIQANNKSGKKMSFGAITVDKFKPPVVPESLRGSQNPWYVNADTAEINYAMRKAQAADDANIKLTGRVLKEVNIKAKTIIKNTYNPLGAGESDFAYTEKDIKQSGTMNLYDLLRQKVPGFNISNNASNHDSYGNLVKLKAPKAITPGSAGTRDGFAAMKINGQACTVTIDGSKLPITMDDPYSVEEMIDEVSQFQIATLSGLEVIESTPLRERLKAKGYPDGPWIVITTINGNGWYKSPKTGTVTYRPLPILYPQQFYSPKYNVISNVKVPDYRPTLYWEPNITTDQNGKAKVSFYTSDIKEKYTVKVAGVDGNGGIGDGSLKLNQPATIN
ncbi:hypothetical protein FO440_10150 [Mucilaginibacter corticis]|uniref:Uncharacterized protein n=1 Tax=Mucilaginibacter corticis TaxID=2597670 RepID=A0A556MX49_9SPHI|nr:carboxypeptidase-like regulatory domain-containing protein [Mucilaginibacter corticis]TSJ44514.1 hypothetical protein FO440_10150 [Mucilaginibacter corticis]